MPNDLSFSFSLTNPRKIFGYLSRLSTVPSGLPRLLTGVSCALLLAACTGGGGASGDVSSGDGTGSTIGSATPAQQPTGDADAPGGGAGPSDTPLPGNPPGDPTGGAAGGGGGGAGGGGGGGGGGDDQGDDGTIEASVEADPGPATTSTQRVVVPFTGTSNDDGIADIAITLANTDAFQVVTAVASPLYIGTLELIAPDGAELLDADDNDPPFTTALGFDTLLNSLPYETRAVDASVVDGTYKQQIGTAQASGFNLSGVSTAFSGNLVAKNDVALGSGTLRANVFLFGAQAQTAANRNAVEDAIAIWRDIYDGGSNPVVLDVQMFDMSGTGVVPLPPIGSSLFQNTAQAQGVPAFAVNVFIGQDISSDGTSNPGNPFPALGVAPAIPGPATATTKSAVAVSLAEHQGADGLFDESEVALLGETIAHEVGHYLGLFHPVEGFAGFAEGDRLEDTPTCSSESSCVANGLAANNMFPFPVEGVVQRVLTDDQREVLNLQVIVD